MADSLVDILDSFSCVRVRTDRKHLRMVKSFKCIENETLTDYIRRKAWEDDLYNRRAVYLVKHKEQSIFFFSLQCGSMYEPYKKKELERSFANFHELQPYVQEIRDLTNGDDISNHILQLLSAGVLSMDKFKTLMENYRNSEKARNIVQDEKEDPNNRLKRVYKSLPVIELVHFCANEKNKDIVWDKDALHTRLGEAIFFKFISPIVEGVAQQIGCTQLFLFASDDTKEEHLIRYYIGQMNFQRDEQLQPKKTDFSLFCTPLSQKIDGMQARREQFFTEHSAEIKSEDLI